MPLMPLTMLMLFTRTGVLLVGQSPLGSSGACLAASGPVRC
jgi:hypothetical protein